MATACPCDNRVCSFLVPAPLYVTTPGTCWWKVSHFLPWKISKRPTWISLQNALKIILKQMSAYNQPRWDLTFAAQTDGDVCMLVFTMIWDFSELKFRFLTLRQQIAFYFKSWKKKREREKICHFAHTLHYYVAGAALCSRTALSALSEARGLETRPGSLPKGIS